MYLPRRVNFEKGGRGLGKTALQKLQLISVGVVRKTSIWHVEAIRFQVLGQESVSLAGQFLATWTCGWGGFFFLVRLAPPPKPTCTMPCWRSVVGTRPLVGGFVTEPSDACRTLA